MKLLTSQEDFLRSKSKDLLKLECKKCQAVFLKPKKLLQIVIKGNATNKADFCSLKCQHSFRNTQQNCFCKNCGASFLRRLKEIKNTKNNFCSNKCAGVFNNAHKTKGCRRSKLEVWLQEKLKETFPAIKIVYNDKTAIQSELDIYIPELKLAFELNGPFHYEPIYGLDTLSDIQKRDRRKIISCYEQEIELCVIDTSSQKYFKEKTSQKYLEIIFNIINNRLS